MLRLVVAAFMAALTALVTGASLAADIPIGSVTRIQGDAFWRAGNRNELLFPGAPVFTNQRVSTGAEARLELTFDDGTALILGENAQMTLDRFVYDPDAGKGTFKAAVRGAFRFVSGQVSKQPDKDVTIATSIATIGIRGTDFWGGPIDDQALGVVLFEGAVTVTNAAGEQALDVAGQGTNIASPSDAPGPITIWPQDKVDRAVATITFR